MRAQEVKRKHARWLRNNQHIRYMWIPYSDAIVVVTNMVVSVLPVALATTAGMALVYINNYVTGLRTGGNYFPGERALIEQEHMRRGRRI